MAATRTGAVTRPIANRLLCGRGFAASDDFALGSVGAGLGARTVNFKGGIGSASAACDGVMLGALAAVNAVGSVVVDDGPWFWAAPFEIGAEFGGRGFPSPLPPRALDPRTKGSVRGNTTLIVVATDAALSKSQAKRLAVMAQDGLARAIYPAHTPLDGDLVFAASTGRRPLADPVHGLMRLGTCAVQVVARAIARGVYEAASSGRATWQCRAGATFLALERAISGARARPSSAPERVTWAPERVIVMGEPDFAAQTVLASPCHLG